MTNKIEILGIIPARSGSKTIKNKNLINIKGHPLIYYSIFASKKSNKPGAAQRRDSKIPLGQS